jgi:hypothetical protein
LSPKELEKLASLKAARRINELAEEIAREQERQAGELASEGTLHSAAGVQVIMNLALRRIDGVIRAQYEAFREVCESAGLLTNALLREYGQIQALQYANRPVLQAIEAASVGDGLMPASTLRKMVSSELDRLRETFLRDVQIDAANLSNRATDGQTTTTIAARKKWDVFVSFATTDRAVAEIAIERLRQQGLRVFPSPKELQEREEWSEVMRVVLVTSAELCLIVSKASLKKGWVLKEWGAAWATAKRITPVLVDLEVKDLPVRLKSRQCIGTQDLSTYALQVAERILGKPNSSPQPS